MSHSYFKIYKPYGYLSQFKYPLNRRKNKKLLGALYSFPEGSMSAGRLDEDSEGLLLITTDGSFSYQITSTGIEKEYYVQVDGSPDPEAIAQLKSGVYISINGKEYLTKPARVKKLNQEPCLPNRLKRIRDSRHGPSSWLSITLTEGKFRQVRKMTAAVGYPTLRLVRVRIGNIMIDQMEMAR